MSTTTNPIEERRAARRAVDNAEDLLVETGRSMTITAGPRNPPPPMRATKAQLLANPQHEITLNVEWIAAALHHQRSRGWKTAMDLLQPLMDYANSHPAGHRNAFDDCPEPVRDLLRELLDGL